MSHTTTAAYRRSYAPPSPEIPMAMDHPKHQPPDADADVDPPVTTVQNISNHFSRLYLNHKARSSFTTPTQPPPATDTSTNAYLTKSQSQRSKNPQKRGKPHYYYFNKPVKEQEDNININIKRAIVVSSKSKIEESVQGYSVDLKEEIPKDVEKQCLSSSSTSGGVGRRRSFGSSSQAELTDFFACNGVKVVSADMPPYMQIHVVDVTRKTYDSLEKFTAKTLALTLKKEFDGVYGPAWHCIVGSSFGSFVTHSVGGFMYFSMDHKIYVLLFKTAVQKAH